MPTRRCEWFGCKLDDNIGGCRRCYARFYEDFIDDDWCKLWWLHRAWWSLTGLWYRRWLPHCAHCNRLLMFRRRFNKCFCSEKCNNDWMPF